MDYIDFLINKHGKSPKKKKPFKFDWQGGLSEISKNILLSSYNIKQWIFVNSESQLNNSIPMYATQVQGVNNEFK